MTHTNQQYIAVKCDEPECVFGIANNARLCEKCVGSGTILVKNPEAEGRLTWRGALVALAILAVVFLVSYLIAGGRF